MRLLMHLIVGFVPSIVFIIFYNLYLNRIKKYNKYYKYNPASISEHSPTLQRSLDEILGTDLSKNEIALVEAVLFAVEHANVPNRPGMEYDTKRPNYNKVVALKDVG